MSDKGNRGHEIKGTPSQSPDGSIKGIHVGDPTPVVKGSYTPTSQAPPPPPPTKKK